MSSARPTTRRVPRKGEAEPAALLQVIEDRVIELRRVPADKLLRNPSAWRRHPGRQRDCLRALLAEVGFAGAILARETSEGLAIVDGHMRAEECAKQVVPVLVLDIDRHEADLLLAAFDPIGSLAVPDRGAMAELLERVKTSSVETRQLLGELRRRFGIAPLGEPGLALVAPERPRTRPGELFVIGRHRLLCGNACDPTDVNRLLGKARPELCVADPPYGTSYDPAWRRRAAESGLLSYAARRVGAFVGDERSDWGEALSLFEGDVVYLWHAGLHAKVAQKSLEDAGFQLRAQIIWAKPHVPIGRGNYHWRHEPCYYAVRRGRSARWCGGRQQTTLWEVGLDAVVPGGHGAQKPVELMARSIRNHDARAVYDPFLGSGTTMVAAEREGVACLGMEVDPAWCDISIARMEAETRTKARRC